MSTVIGSNPPDGPSEISLRKNRHLEVCLNRPEESISGSDGSGFSGLSFVHEALPELDADAVDTSCLFLDYSCSLPLFISSMTGGTYAGRQLNAVLAEAAERCRIPLCLGSIRILLEEEAGYWDDFYIKKYAPTVPVLANLGGVQLPGLDFNRLRELLNRLEVQGLIIHLNPGQELVQPGGDRNFSGILHGIQRAVEELPLPVIVKETGFGIRPGRVRQLLDAGVDFVDLSGAGGTNWMLVEAEPEQPLHAQVAGTFRSWGLSCAELLLLTGKWRPRILASGGIRSGLDLAKAVALGALLGGMALPFAKAAATGGVDAVCALVEQAGAELRTAMVLTGSADLNQLAQRPLIRSLHLAHRLAELERCGC